MGFWPFKRKAAEPAPAEASPPVTGASAAGESMGGWWFFERPASTDRLERYDGEPRIGGAGLQAASGPLSALLYTSGAFLCRVKLSGTVVNADERSAGTRRRVLRCLDSEELRAFAVETVEGMLGVPLESAEFHRREAGANRERLLDAIDRERNARWVLSEGAAREDGNAKAKAEGELAGAARAAAETRAVAELHDAAAVLTGAGGTKDLARALDHLTKACAAFEPGGADEALVEARAKLETKLIARLNASSPAVARPEQDEGSRAAASDSDSASHSDSDSPVRSDLAPTVRRAPPPSTDATLLSWIDVMERVDAGAPEGEN